MSRFDVIVIGGGHAGTEAAAASARMGASTALISFTRKQIGTMSCNPAMGGLGKGHLIREVDAFDGIIARASDASAIHYRMLNASKGAAVRGPRVQADRRKYQTAVHEFIDNQDNLTIVEGEVTALRLKDCRVTGVNLAGGKTLHAGAVVLATGTFLGGKLFFGLSQSGGGRIGERPATAMSAQLRGLGLPMARLKTGTPPRLDGRTIDWSQLERQPSDTEGWTMSPLTTHRRLPQLFCALSRTNARTHAIVRDALDQSPLHSGDIEGAGPRYCPSIEDKVRRFGDRDGHQIFLEPEGLDDPVVYPNGISTSLPADVQLDMLRSMAGLDQVEVVQPGYAVEYDHVDPRVLDPALAVRAYEGLYLAGQINGTTGYEEASAQGLVAGLNAAASVGGEAPILFDRATSYIGVMIDDLVLQGVTEPYRMLTARAEYRLRLRADNAETRLSRTARAAGCLSPARLAHLAEDEAERAGIETLLCQPTSVDALRLSGADIKDGGHDRALSTWIRYPQVDADMLKRVAPALRQAPDRLLDEAIQDHRYLAYVARQEKEVLRLRADEALTIPSSFDYALVPGLSHEMVERLDVARPASLGAAARVRGITPAALSAIVVGLRRRGAA